jgi:nucleotide-binding universal stress UspA family protein
MSFQKILVAIDNSPLCQLVFAQSLELARANRAKLMLLHCLSTELVGEPPVPLSIEMGVYPEAMSSAYQAQQAVAEQRILESQKMLTNYSETAYSQGVPTECDCKIGDAGEWLCQVAQNWGADLIVLGRRGRTGLTEAFLGSVSNHVLHHAPCSVLVIQPEAEGKAS